MDANGRNCTPSTSTGHPKQIPTIFSFSNRDMQGRGGLGTMNEHCTPIHSYFKEMDDHVLAKKGKVRSNSSLRTTRNDTRLMTTAHEQPHYGETLDVPYKIFWCWWLWKITRTFSQNNPSQLNKALRSIRKEHWKAWDIQSSYLITSLKRLHHCTKRLQVYAGSAKPSINSNRYDGVSLFTIFLTIIN